MPLPTISTPTYELTLPSSERKIKFRPFLVKEEKILILAMESQDSKQIATAVKDVLKKCGQTLQTESSMVRTLFEGRRQTHVDGRPCCVGRDCHLVLHLDGWLI